MSKFRALACALAAFPLSALVLGSTVSSAAAKDPEVIIKVTNVRALDRADEMSDGDFFARVTINGEKVESPVVKQEGNIKPDWVLSKKVKAGVVKVDFQIIDKDLADDDPIDVNRVDNKRNLEFTVNTRNCRIDGFATRFKCGQKITRAGKEKKAAEVTFIVTVKK
jgi:hypothetical protein